MSSNLDYVGIKALSKSLGRPAGTLYALSAANDPFYLYPARVEGAQWFAKLWRKLKLRPGMHTRGIHYIFVSQKKPVLTLDGKPYENTLDDYKRVKDGCRDARYLGLVPASAIVDRRNDEPYIRLVEGVAVPAGHNVTWTRPVIIDNPQSMPPLPQLVYSRMEVPQRYHIEIWCEKTTMNDVLQPLADRYDCNVITGSGELSLTHCYQVVERAVQSQKPVRILYISDFDPAGMSMPLAVARKIEFRLRRDNINLNIQLRPIVLTHDQCVHYRLPRTPIKETAKGAIRFEERFGEGATELDALEALHPGELGSIIEREIGRYYDDTLASRVQAANDKVARRLGAINGSVHDEHSDDIETLKAEWDEIVEDYQAQLERWRRRAESFYHGITCSLEAETPDLDDIEMPEPAEGDEDEDPLFDSTRDYVEQIDRYKQHQDKPTEGNMPFGGPKPGRRSRAA
jgi:hypothetical protein